MSFSDDVPVGTDSVFIDYFWVRGAVGIDESMRHLWKLFRCLFLSQQGLRALPNPRVTFGRCFGDDFQVGTDSVFVDFFWVNRGCSSSKCARHLVKVFQWWFLSRQQLSFLWLFLSQLGLWALTNPHVSFGSSFVVFFWVNRGCEPFRIHASPLEGASVMISRSAPTLFSLTFSESTGAVTSSESTRHLWKALRWWFPGRHRLYFRWLFLSQQGLSPLPSPCVTFERRFGDDFPVGTDSVFIDFFWVNRGCHLFRIHVSPLKGVSAMIFQSAPSLFSLTFSESTGAVSSSESTRHLLKVFRWWFPHRHRLHFRWCFWVNRSYELFQIHSSPLEGASVMISQSAPTLFSLTFSESTGCHLFRIHVSPLKGVSATIFQSAPSLFSLTFSESTGAASSSESTRHLLKEFRWWFVRWHRLRFRWRFLVNRSCELFRIHASPFEGVSVTFSKSTGAVSSFESTRHLWKVFWWWFRRRQRLSFHWLVLSQQGLWVLTNPPSPLEVVSLTFSESTGAASASESKRHLWKVFR